MIYIIDSINQERNKLGIWKWEKGAQVMIGIESWFQELWPVERELLVSFVVQIDMRINLTLGTSSLSFQGRQNG